MAVPEHERCVCEELKRTYLILFPFSLEFTPILTFTARPLSRPRPILIAESKTTADECVPRITAHATGSIVDGVTTFLVDEVSIGQGLQLGAVHR